MSISHPPTIISGGCGRTEAAGKTGVGLEEVGKRIGEGTQTKARDNMEYLRKHRWFCGAEARLC